MKQILQSLKDGTTEVADVPAPRVGPGQVLVRASRSLVSAGTERMLLQFGRGNLLQKARQQPDKVREVMEKVVTDGLATTIEAVRSKLDQPVELGYCHVGRVIESRAQGFAPGDRVVSNGKHAEIVAVPKHLCARVPEPVSDEAAAFTVLGAIGLQGIRLAAPTLGERVAVIGLGLIGLMTVQMLRAQGCHVLGIDLDPDRLSVAEQFGARTVAPGHGDDVLEVARTFSRGAGMDAVLITASTASNEPVSQAARMCRKRGRIVLVGVTGLELSRADFYEKELSFQVSCSYGPGRYDPTYEQQGQDYPIGFVRWTEQRNLEAVLDLMASGGLDVSPLVSHRFTVTDAPAAFELLAGGDRSLGILLEYPTPTGDHSAPARRLRLAQAPATSAAGRVAFLGAGNYASRVLVPAFRAAGASLELIVSAGGVSALDAGRRHGVAEIASDERAAFDDDRVDTVVVATRHDVHARQVLAALRAGRHVFCEKPLCLNREELEEIEQEVDARPDQRLMVGFNRRFAPHVQRMKTLLAPVDQPKHLVLTVNAGAIPADHWTHDRAVGGGRIIGEACHFVDLARHLVGVPVVDHEAHQLGPHPGLEIADDKATLRLGFADGSVAVIHYLANGHKGFPKERVEVFTAGRILQLDNFLLLRGWGWSGFRRMRLWRQDKGARACVGAFVSAVRTGGPSPIAVEELFEVSRVSIALAEALH